MHACIAAADIYPLPSTHVHAQACQAECCLHVHVASDVCSRNTQAVAVHVV